MSTADQDDPGCKSDPAAYLISVYRQFPGLRALILRRVRDPELAADILQDAVVTILEKLYSGEIKNRDNVAGYLYRVALNHVRNHWRKEKTAARTASFLAEELDADPLLTAQCDTEQQRDWADAVRLILRDLPVQRDREILVRYYLGDEEKSAICIELGVSESHFSRVIFRARNRFRALLEMRGWSRGELLSILMPVACLILAMAGNIAPVS
jgi:RNA polymerase sigma-70 factor, ECF subfamily